MAEFLQVKGAKYSLKQNFIRFCFQNDIEPDSQAGAIAWKAYNDIAERMAYCYLEVEQGAVLGQTKNITDEFLLQTFSNAMEIATQEVTATSLESAS